MSAILLQPQLLPRLKQKSRPPRIYMSQALHATTPEFEAPPLKYLSYDPKFETPCAEPADLPIIAGSLAGLRRDPPCEHTPQQTAMHTVNAVNRRAVIMQGLMF